MAAVPGAASGGGGDAVGKKASTKGLRGARRRLSVVSDNKLVEGVASLAEDGGRDKGKAKPAEHIVKTYAGVSRKGYAPYNPRKRNQDSLIMREHAPTTTLFFGVLDGHGEAGDLVSGFFAKRMPKQIFAHPKFSSDPGKAMADEQAKLERELLLDASIDTDFSGTTSVLATIRGKTLSVANVGDSRIILGRLDADGKLKAVEVSDDHKPDRPDEQKRIEAKGGRVFAVEYEDGVDGPPRVWLGNMDIPGLAMARSLGDVVAHSAGVISTPEHHQVELTSADKICVMGSDGLWEFMSNQEVIDMVVSSGMKDPSDAVDMLAEESAARWMREEEVIDDTTIIVAYM